VSFRRKIASAGKSIINWATSGSPPSVLVKLGVVFTAATGVALSPVLTYGYLQANALERRLETFKGRPTVVFTSVAHCEEKHYHAQSCEASRRAAMNIADGIGTGLSYSFKSDCVAVHTECHAVGTHLVQYRPYVVAWQAAAENISESVPLYHGPTPDIALRPDGVKFRLPR